MVRDAMPRDPSSRFTVVFDGVISLTARELLAGVDGG